MTVTSGKKKMKSLPRKSAENAKGPAVDNGPLADDSAERGDWLALRDVAAPALFRLWQQQRVSLDLALQAARTLSLTDQALAAQVEDPEGYLRSQILAAKRAEEDTPPAPPVAAPHAIAGGEITAGTAMPHSSEEAQESPVVAWSVRVEYVEGETGKFDFDDYADAAAFFHEDDEGYSIAATFLYEVRADGTSWEIARAQGVPGLAPAEIKAETAVPHSSGVPTPVERAYRGLNWHAPDLLTLHPIAEAYPAMSEVEFAALVEDIRANGQREPVWVDAKGRIVDGRHRWLACKALDNKLVKTGYCSDLGLTTEAELRAFAASQNLHRRHLNESQRAMAAASLVAAPRAKEKGKGNKEKTKTGEESANLQSGGLTVAAAAEKLKVSPRSVATAKKVMEKGTPEVIAAVQAGTVSVSAAAKGLEEPKKTLRALTKAERAWLSGNDYKGGPDSFRRDLDKKTHIRLRFLLVEGKRERWVAGWEKPGASVGCGGATIGFFKTLREATEVVEAWIATEFEGKKKTKDLPRKNAENAKNLTTDYTDSTDEITAGTAVPHSFPEFIPGVTEGSPFKTPDDVNQEGFRFDVLCQGVELLRWLGPASALEFSKPTQDQVDYLVEFLERTAGALDEIAAAFAAQVVEDS